MPIIPIVFSINDAYAPYLYVCLKSLLANARSRVRYHIFVLQAGLSAENRQHLLSLREDRLEITFVDCSEITEKYGRAIFATSFHFTIETYYRFFLPDLFPDFDKVLYLDADTLIRADVAPLFDTDIGDHYLGVTHDCEIVRAAHVSGTKYSDYFTRTLGVEIENYFQAGVMIANLAQMRRDNITRELIDCLKRIKTPRFLDQDILNAVCQGKVQYIPQNWNFTWHSPFFDPRYSEHIGGSLATEYENAGSNPYIIHFTGHNMKPVDYPLADAAQLFLAYAHDTPYDGEFRRQLTLSRKRAEKDAELLEKSIKHYKLLNLITLGLLSKRIRKRIDNKRLRMDLIEKYTYVPREKLVKRR